MEMEQASHLSNFSVLKLCHSVFLVSSNNYQNGL